MEIFAKHARVIFLGGLALGVMVIWYAVFYFASRQHLGVTVFDVGQGDAIFIEVSGGNQILVDGGPNDRILAKLGAALPFWDRSIDLLIVTHPHADHIGGFLDVLKRYEVGMVMTSGVGYGTPEYEEWEKLIKQYAIPVVLARKGQRIDAGSGVVLDILSPAEDVTAGANHPHGANIISRLSYGDTAMLLTGDAERALEYRLLFESPDMLDADILKVGHHGSKTSSTETFLKAVSPDVAVISAGKKNRYGHPHQEVMERLAQLDIAVLRTDQEGDIRIESDGAGWRLIGR
ncbi:MAG: hypothetical protein A3C92_00710 [Candidatus Sungbacteria bacterium RIFCSPHIGHO2_02_FULL_53_17]|uniref:Metallo-beta-lactamase domain-containing protein n=1 Tax=Candidatus Sungbacteria bacterium RIFCSPHIGHO2_02_FULL_53_17 TaxID=1802275 RepID=A0A1G2KTT1_9BACT|nr:MAG: hypothetical protein A3C92_00710 [Candidatus Sungbacteria bacterium RIFCSPHIGHO2_02_FULL_53_17]